MRKSRKVNSLGFSPRLYAPSVQIARIRCLAFSPPPVPTQTLPAGPSNVVEISPHRPCTEAGYKIISKAEVVRFPSALPAYPPAEPQVQHVVQVDVRQQWGQDRTLRGPFLVAWTSPSSMMPLLSIRMISLMTRSSPIRCRRNLIIHAWLSLSKNLLISASTTWLTFFCCIVRPSASKHMCGLRPGRYA